MASLINVRLSKGDSPNLGFRLQGGKDFATPLIIQKVNPGSPAERAGLTSGDAVIKINNTDVFNLKHKDAQDVVVRAGPAFEMTIQRGGLTWKPSVVPVGPAPKPSPSINNVSPVTKTSLAKNPSENIGAIGTGHNLSAKPFGPQLNGAVNGGPKLVNKQYNSPVHLYSEDSIAETLAAQSEVLAPGVVGVNFKKNERNYDASNSAVLRVLKETENEPKSPDEEPDSGVVTASNSGIAGLRRVQAPETRPQPANAQLPPGQNICDDCERLIVGVFVRIKDKNLHVECFKCSTCGTSLKNVGYYNISNKLYCDIHAKSAAIRSNANPNLVPVTVPPGSKAPAHAISSALSSHSLPSPSPLSPKLNNNLGSPYQTQETKENVEASTLTLANSNVTEANHNTIYSPPAPLSFSKYLHKSSNFSGPKPFSSVSAPLSPHNTLPRSGPLSPNKTLPRTGPLSPGAPISAPSYNSPSFSPASSAEHVSGLHHARESENTVELDEVGLQIPNHPPPPPPVPVYTQINITIPSQSISPQLDSMGSSPRSDYSSYSSSSSRIHHSNPSEAARDKIITEIKNLAPKLKKTSLSGTQSPRLNFVVNNLDSSTKNETKRVSSEIFIPINNFDSTESNSQSSLPLPDHIYTIRQSDRNDKESTKTFINSVTMDAKDYRNRDNLPEVPICCKCNIEIARGPFITALGKIWCPNHFICATPSCRRPLQDLGFVEEKGQLYCEYCFEQYLAPPCAKCSAKIKGDCLKAIGKNFHPECFNCVYCGKLFANSPFFLEDGSPYCEADWNELFTTKCFACGFPVEAGDRWVEALNNNYHSQCFNCTMCKKNLEGQSFFAKGGRPFCKNHAR